MRGIDGVTPAERDKWRDIDAVYGWVLGPRCLDTVDTVDTVYTVDSV